MDLRRIRTIAAAALLAGAAAVALDAQPAAAAVTGCVYGSNLSLNQMSATCTTTLAERWYLRLTCERLGTGHDIYANGSLVYGPGRDTSIARCPLNTEIVGTTIAYL
ncbi:hypothetical protein ACQP1P_32860 [Dactylosporangium sp. CA-052675]|uniref:hypothetical protein n=1 Tax=Dactylosporangium sp. CA-052675 TaxID=3239927 RepID=UPI003D942251